MYNKYGKPNVIRGGKAIPLGNNFYYMKGRKHSSGGIDIGKDLEVEDDEIMQMGGKSIRVFSSVPFLNGNSPSHLLLDGANPDKVFAAQENFKDRFRLNDDGTRKAKYGKRFKAENGIGLDKFKNGDIAKDVINDTIISQCAKWQNQQLRNAGYYSRGSAWQPSGTKVFSGFNEANKPTTYSREAVNTYNQAAADSLYKNFITDTSLDTSKIYTANMYYAGSPAQEEAYYDGYDGITGTHTGYLKFNQNDKRWKLYHNIHGNIHRDDFKRTQGKGKKYGVTAIYEPNKDNGINFTDRFKGFTERTSKLKNRIINKFK